ncbi:MAG TPA: hypothetical protein VJK05_04355 [archaeon]|nr:hypothetical protein [archaeon]
MNKLKLLEKSIARITGNAFNTLNSIASNEVATGKPNAFLESNGKLVLFFDLFIESNESIYLVFEKKFLERALSFFKKYLLISKCKFELLDWKTFFSVSGENIQGKHLKIPCREGFLIIGENPLIEGKEFSEKEFNLFRVENNISVQGIDFDQEMFLNLNYKEAVSFSKGCFIGQEVMARVNNLSKPPKKLVRVKLKEKSSKVFSEEKEIGEATSLAFSPELNSFIGFSLLPNIELILDNAEIF